MDSIPRSIPEGVWLTEFSLNKKDGDRVQLILKGMSYFKDSDKEFGAINKFLNNLRQDAVFTKYFTDLSIISIDQNESGRVTATSFSLSCRNYKEGK
jgi:Tfp pilus assembly protein PilN